MKRERREVTRVSFGFSSQTASHIKLVKGVVRINPHVRVLCPTLAKNLMCRKNVRIKRGDTKVILRPKLLVKNHGNLDLQLWSCEGCPNFLLRVSIIENT